jgi:NDP-sugar pyrophosphorylase family protein
VPPGGRFLVLNADTWLDAQAYRLAFGCPSDAIVAVLVDDRERYGSLDCADNLELLALNEKGATGPGRVNAGVYAFAEDSLREFPIQSCSMEQDILPRLIERRQLLACEYSGPFIDIGTPDSLRVFRAALQGTDV